MIENTQDVNAVQAVNNTKTVNNAKIISNTAAIPNTNPVKFADVIKGEDAAEGTETFIGKDDEEDEKKRKAAKYLQFFLMFFIAGIIAGAGSFFYGKENADIICNTIMVMLGTGMVIFTLVFSEVNDLYYYANQGKYGKFVLFYLTAMALSLLFPLLPVSGWPFWSYLSS